MDELTKLANACRSDKGNRFHDRHFYTRVYRELFAPLKDRPISLLEIGLQRPENASTSLSMWQRYFRNARVVGFDIRPFDGCIRGDSSKREDLAKVGSGFDIVIDDASHASDHQQTAFGFLASRMNPGGIYIIEDLHWQPSFSEGPKTCAVLKAFQQTGRFVSPHMSEDETACLEARVKEIMFFDSLRPWHTLANADALAVIRFGG